VCAFLGPALAVTLRAPMPTSLPNQPMQHDDDRTDAELGAEAGAQLARSPSLQLVAELLGRLREMKLPWWTPQQLRAAYPAAERLSWLASRPDIRQRITTQLTGLAPRAARNKSPAFQAELIDSVVDEGDISVDDFEHAFDPVDLALYGPAPSTGASSGGARPGTTTPPLIRICSAGSWARCSPTSRASTGRRAAPC
jgi:hypothetical protein